MTNYRELKALDEALAYLNESHGYNNDEYDKYADRRKELEKEEAKKKAEEEQKRKQEEDRINNLPEYNKSKDEKEYDKWDKNR